MDVTLTKQQSLTAEFRLAVKKRSDNLMNYFLIGFFLTGLVLAVFYGTWLIGIGVGSISLIAYYSVKIALPDSDMYQYVLSVIMAIFMAQYIYQMHGLFEMHFFAFIGSAILITYQNWKLQIPMLIVVLVHHALLGYLQNIGYDQVYFTQLSTFELQAYVIHIMLSAVIFFTCGLWGYQLKKYSEKQIGQVIEMTRLQQEALLAEDARKREIEQRSAILDKAVAQGKFEMASDVLHDIGNAVVGFGSYLTRVRRLQEHDRLENLAQLTGFFEGQFEPLTGVLGETKATAVITMLRGLSETQKKDQDEVRKAVEEQMNIINQIQEILHIQRQYITGQETQERKAANLKGIINDSVAILYASLEKNGIEVEMDVPEDLPTLKGDRTRLMQVIMSVLKNSVEAIDKDTATKVIRIKAFTTNTPSDNRLEIQIRDSGIGFGSAVGCRLFERSFTTKPGSRGLGLYNCKAILESHAGTIDITSEGIARGALARISFKI